MFDPKSLVALGLFSLAAAVSPANNDSPASLDPTLRATLNNAYNEALRAGLNNDPDHKHKKDSKHEKDPKEEARKEILKKCNSQCGKTGAACSSACLANLLGLNVGNLAPCFAACGTASAACHNACTQAEIEEHQQEIAEALAAAAEASAV